MPKHTEVWPECKKANLRGTARLASTRAVRNTAEMTSIPSNRTILNQELRARGEEPV